MSRFNCACAAKTPPAIQFGCQAQHVHRAARLEPAAHASAPGPAGARASPVRPPRPRAVSHRGTALAPGCRCAAGGRCARHAPACPVRAGRRRARPAARGRGRPQGPRRAAWLRRLEHGRLADGAGRGEALLPQPGVHARVVKVVQAGQRAHNRAVVKVVQAHAARAQAAAIAAAALPRPHAFDAPSCGRPACGQGGTQAAHTAALEAPCQPLAVRRARAPAAARRAHARAARRSAPRSLAAACARRRPGAAAPRSPPAARAARGCCAHVARRARSPGEARRPPAGPGRGPVRGRMAEAAPAPLVAACRAAWTHATRA